ncbi:hypothetical protein BDA99DRAFT_575046 [Phascolomyces articulosus]|uniref:Uncharacterized protein n=1 Tax=Phascolomyces articulosus TaxID=60185 RepID=A0AAD5P9W2_9FUNG|nr:hypothetical protein BDA99DRAFT_575046 [Phascolomyces articulosus]
MFKMVMLDVAVWCHGWAKSLSSLLYIGFFLLPRAHVFSISLKDICKVKKSPTAKLEMHEREARQLHLERPRKLSKTDIYCRKIKPHLFYCKRDGATVQQPHLMTILRFYHSSYLCNYRHPTNFLLQEGLE